MSTQSAAQQIAAGYAVQGQALELGTVVVNGTADATARIRIPLATVNRHGLVAGATGTGKTKSLQVMAEQLSAAGVPVPPQAPPPAEAGAATTSGQVVAKKAAEPGMVQEVLESSAFKSILRSAATAAGREITRSILGTGTRRR